MAKTDFLIKLGLSPDTVQNQKTIDLVVGEVQKALKDKFDIDIKSDSIDETISKIEELTKSITPVRDEFGELTGVVTEFKPIQDFILKVNTSVKTVTKSFEQFRLETGRTKNEIADLIRQGNALDADGNAVTKYSQRGSVASIIEESSASSSTNLERDMTIAEEIEKKYRKIISLQKQITPNNWRSITKQIELLVIEQDKYIKANEGAISESSLSSIQSRYGDSIDFNYYNQILTVYEKLRKNQISLNNATEKRTPVLKQQQEMLSEQLSALENLRKNQGYEFDEQSVAGENQARRTDDIYFEETGFKEMNDRSREATIAAQELERQLGEIESKYKELRALQSQLSGDNWMDVKKKIESLNKEIRSLNQGYRESGNQSLISGSKEIRDSSYEKTSEIYYEQILGLQKEIESVQKEQITADAKSLVLLKEKEERLKEQVRYIASVSDFTDEQKLSLVSNKQQSSASVSQKSDDKYIAQLNENLREQLKLEKEIGKSSADESSEYIAFKRAEIKTLQDKQKAIQEEISDRKRLSEALSEYNRKLAQQKNEENFSSDNASIQKAIDLQKQLAKAETDLFKLQSQHAPSSVIKESQEDVIKLQVALNEATSAQLSNGSAVEKSEKYQREANKAARDAVIVQKQLEAQYKGINFSLDAMVDRMIKVGKNVIQYNLAWSVFNKVDEILIDSIGTIKDLDTAMTNVQLVTGQTNEQVLQVMNSYSDLAMQLGATTLEVAEGSIEWLLTRSFKTALTAGNPLEPFELQRKFETKLSVNV